MRKKLKIALIVLVLIMASTLNIYAANTADLTVTANKTEIKIGDTVTINLSANCENGIEGIDSTLEYDKTKLELQPLNVDSKFSNMSGTDDSTGEYKLTVISNSADTITQANFATVEFKVLDTAQEGEEITVKLSAIELGDSNDDWTDITNKEVKLEVVGETTGNGNNNPGTEGTDPEDDKNPGTEGSDPEEDKNPGTEGSDPEDDKNPGTEGSEPEEDKKPETEDDDLGKENTSGNKDNTQADKEINHAGLEDYIFVVIAVITILAFVSYKKYQQYKNI